MFPCHILLACVRACMRLCVCVHACMRACVQSTEKSWQAGIVPHPCFSLSCLGSLFHRNVGRFSESRHQLRILGEKNISTFYVLLTGNASQYLFVVFNSPSLEICLVQTASFCCHISTLYGIGCSIMLLSPQQHFVYNVYYSSLRY